MNSIEERILIINRYREKILSHLTEYSEFYSDTFIKTQFRMMNNKISDLEAQKKVFISSNSVLSDSVCPRCGKDLMKTTSEQIYCVCDYEK